MHLKNITTLTAISAALVLVACGGGSDTVVPPAATTPTTTTPTTPTPTPTIIKGTAVKGPVTDATVTVKKASDGTVLATTKTGAGGAYTVNVDYMGDVVIEISGGKYTDEATQKITDLAAPLKAVLTTNGGTVDGIVTPVTTMAFTAAFPSASSAVTKAAFDTQVNSLASQFKLSAADLATTPVVTGTTNAYGKVLAGLSTYLQYENKTLPQLVNSTFTTADWTAFSGTYANAYKAATGIDLQFSFTGNTATITGTGTGGGTGTCGVNVKGTISANGFSVPLNLDYCITGVAAGSCTAGNASLSQALSGQQGMAGAANLAYTYTAACVANPAMTIKLN